MNLNVQLSPEYLQKNIPEYALYEDMYENPFQYTCYKNYIDNIKDCINLEFEDEFDFLEIESFVSFNNEQMDSLNKPLYMDFHIVKTNNMFDKFVDNIDFENKYNITYIKNILHYYEHVLTFHQYFNYDDKRACVIIMLCYGKKLFSKNIVHISNNLYYINKFSYKKITNQNIDEFNNIYNDIIALEKSQDKLYRVKQKIIEYFGNSVNKKIYKFNNKSFKKCSMRNVMECFNNENDISNIISFSRDDDRCEYKYIVDNCVNIFYIVTARAIGDGIIDGIAMYFCEKNEIDDLKNEINDLRSDIVLLKDKLSKCEK